MKSEVNQNFSKATRQADQYGSTVIMENNVPAHTIHELGQINAIQTVSDEEVLAASKTFIQRNKHIYEELAK